VRPGRLHIPSQAASLPMENSPPGIQTIPAGAVPREVDGLEIVGWKVEDEAGRAETGVRFFASRPL